MKQTLGPASRNLEGSRQKSVEVARIRHAYKAIIFSLAIAMLVDKLIVLPCEFHPRVARAVCYGYSLPWRRIIAAFVHEEDRRCWNCGCGCHVKSFPIVGLHDRRRGLRAFDCRYLSWRGDVPFDE